MSAVRFADTAPVVLCEGVETALSVWQASGQERRACLGISNIARAPLADGTTVIIAGDGDEPNSKADQQLRQALTVLRARGHEVTVAEPPLAIRHRPGRTTVVTPVLPGNLPVAATRADPALVKALARAFRYQRLLDEGRCGSISAVRCPATIPKRSTSMKRIAFTMDERGFNHRICADEEVKAYNISPSVPRDRVYRWSSLRAGPEQVDEETEGWPVGDSDDMPAVN